MELYVIVGDWCQVAEQSNAAARSALERRTGERPQRPGQWQLPPWVTVLQMSASPDYLKQVTADTELVLCPPPSWAVRWRAAKARSAARRSLRSMMKLYCPDLLTDFEGAVQGRVAFVAVHRDGFEETLRSPGTSLEVLRSWVARLDESLQALVAVRDALGSDIASTFPLQPPGRG